MAGSLEDGDMERLARSGLEALSAEQGLALFDTACGVSDALVIPVRLVLKAIRSSAGPDGVPVLFQGLTGSAVRRVAVAGSDAAEVLRQRLAGLSGVDRDQVVLDLVCGHAAAVLGHASADAVDSERGFLEVGFDSLTVLDLRNRLGAATGLKLPATLLFDYPRPAVLAEYLRTMLVEDDEDSTRRALMELDKLESVLPQFAADSDARDKLSSRLQDLLSKLAESVPDSGENVVARLGSASDDEMFDFIDNELGML